MLLRVEYKVHCLQPLEACTHTWIYVDQKVKKIIIVTMLENSFYIIATFSFFILIF